LIKTRKTNEPDAGGSAAVTVKLSKSKFVAGCQRLKRLYSQVHGPELAAEAHAAAEAIIEQGREVGMLARQLFPDGVEGALPRKKAATFFSAG
jgi:hypothetical protein